MLTSGGIRVAIGAPGNLAQPRAHLLLPAFAEEVVVALTTRATRTPWTPTPKQPDPKPLDCGSASSGGQGSEIEEFSLDDPAEALKKARAELPGPPRRPSARGSGLGRVGWRKRHRLPGTTRRCRRVRSAQP